MTLKPTAKSLRSQLMDKLINVKGLSKSGARSVIQDLGNSPATLQLALDELNAQGLFSPAPVVQVTDKADMQRAKVPYNFQIEQFRLDALRAISESDGASVSHHIRQAVADYLKKHAKR